MKTKFLQTLIAIMAITILIILTRQVVFLPWWSFLVPVLLAGMFSVRIPWVFPVFLTGFAAGFITWAGGNLYFDQAGNGIVLERVALLVSVSKVVVLLLAGIIGGVLTGLALYTGRALVSPRKVVSMDNGR